MKKYYLFGAGINAYGVIKFFGDVFINVIDNNPAKAGTEFCGYKVIGFDDFLRKWKGETVIVSALRSEDIVKSLIDNGIATIYVSPYIQGGFWKDCGEIINEYKMMELPRITLEGINPFSMMLRDEIERRGYKGSIDLIKKDNRGISDLNKKVFITDVNYESVTTDSIPFHIDLTKQRLHYKSELEKFKGIHAGKRCFAIGNGPSLKKGDIDILKRCGEICFGCNHIFDICKNTEWRPYYYVVADYIVWREIAKEYRFFEEGINTFFLADYYYDDNALPDNCVRFNLLPFSESSKRSFSSDIAREVFSGGSVVFSIIQIAAYMGFNEIYLLGVDCNSAGHFYKTERGLRPHGLRDGDGSWNHYTYAISYWQRAFELARRYAESHGIKIYNATRGGNLEVFERVDFDSLPFLKTAKC